MADDTNRTQTDRGRRAYTAPKGRPTRSRGRTGARRRAFGPVAQWITFAIAVIVIVLIVIMVTGGGDFNPLNDDTLGVPQSSSSSPVSTPGIGGVSQRM